MSNKKSQPLHDCCISGYTVKEAKANLKTAKHNLKLAAELVDTGIVLYEDQYPIIGKAYLRVKEAKQDLQRAKERKL